MSSPDTMLLERATLTASPANTHENRFRSHRIATMVYQHHVPEFCRLQLDQLYESVFSTLDQFEMDNALASANTYIATREGNIETILLFHKNGSQVTVLNQMIALKQDEVVRFAKTIFEKYMDVSVISLKAIQTDMRTTLFPCQQFQCAEDIVAPLPGSVPEYLSSLGKNMRETVKRHTNKVKRSFPTFRFDVQTGDAINDAQLAEIYRLHKERIITRNDVSNVDEEKFRRIVSLARKRGMVAVATIDGHVCAGLICWRVGTHYFMRIIAHDSQYNDYKLGTVCCYLTICECIAQGGTAFHFLSGRLLYKYRFLGVDQPYHQIVLYRTHAHMIGHLRLAWRTAVKGTIFEARLWLQNAERKEDVASRFVTACLQKWRMIKHLRSPGKLRSA